MKPEMIRMILAEDIFTSVKYIKKRKLDRTLFGFERKYLGLSSGKLFAKYMILSRDVPLLDSDFFSRSRNPWLTFRWTFLELRRNLVHEDIHVDKN